MKAFKFIVPMDNMKALADRPGLVYRGCLAVVVAESLEVAKVKIVAYANEKNRDAKWLEVAEVHEVEIVDGAVLAWVF